MGRAVGIDLGTTTSAVAIVGPDGIPTILPNREGERLTPSVVLYQGHDWLVGSSAKQSVADAPDVVQFVKRHMGDRDWAFVTTEGRQLEAEMVSGAILRRIKDDAELVLGEPVTDAVISVPAHFGDPQRKATEDAGEIAGLNVLGLINEPTAAAVSHAVQTGRQGTVLVYDLGGGTFDVTIMDIVERDFRVRSTQGDRNLGGLLWDNALMGYLIGQGHSGGVAEDLMRSPELQERAERAKHTLTTTNEARVPVRVGGRQQIVRVTRTIFEELTRDLLDRTRANVDIALADAGLTADQIDHILLAGGSTRMPMVRDMLGSFFGRPPTPGANPDEAVALGAAVQAAMLAHGSAGYTEMPSAGTPATLTKPDIVIHDVTAHGLGVISFDPATGVHRNHVLLPCNSPIPGCGERRFVTAASGQSVIRLRITEGDDEDVDFVRTIGQARIALPETSGRTPLRVVISLNADAVVYAEVFNDIGNKLGDLEIERGSNLTRVEIDRAAASLRRANLG